MPKFSTGFRNEVLVTGAVRSVLNGGVLRVYAGPTLPMSADAALPGDATLMYTFTVGNDGATPLTFDTTATGGILMKNPAESWQGTAAATGSMTFFRWTKSPDDGSAESTTAVRIQGTVGTAFADLIVGGVDKTLNDPLVVDYFGVAIPAEF